MPLTGTLRDWNDERGFGFIAPTHGGREVFVHVGAFPRDGTRPTAGEKLRYELGRGRDGKPEAVRVTRLAVGVARPPPSMRPVRRRSLPSRWVATLVALCLLAAIAGYGYQRYTGYRHRVSLRSQPAVPAADAAPAADRRCDGRTHCSQMTSCAEATWFINHCPGTQMDGNNDGVPCEQQWCTGLFAK